MRFSRAFILTLATREASLASNILNSIILARWLGAGAVGTYSVVIATANLLALAASFGLSYSNNFMAARRPECAGALFTLSVIPGALVAFPGYFMIVWFPGVAKLLFGNLPVELWALALAGSALLLVNMNLAALLYGLQRFKRHSFITVLTPVGIALTNAAAVIGFGATIREVLAIWTAWNGATLVVTCILLGGLTRPSLRIEWSLVRASMAVGGRSLLNGLLGYASQRGTSILIFRFLGSSATGLYALAMAAAEVVQHAAAALGTLVFTKTSAKQDSPERVCMLVRLHWVLGGAIGLGLIIGAPMVMALVFGPKYSDSALPLRILVLANYFLGAWVLAGSYIAGRHGVPLKLIGLTGLMTLLNLVLCGLWVASMGLAGAAWAAAISNAAIMVIGMFYFRREAEGQVRLRDLAPRWGDFRVLRESFALRPKSETVA